MVSAGTLTDSPQLEVELIHGRKAIQTERTAGFISRRQTALSVSQHTGKPEIRRWRLRWPVASLTVHASILSLYDASSGGAIHIDWTPVDEVSAIEVRFVEGTLRTVQVNPTHFSIEFELEEVL